MRYVVPPVGPDLHAWAGDIRRWLARSWDALTYKQADSNASQDGLMMWDTAGYPVVSVNGEWKRVWAAGAPVTGPVITYADATLGADVNLAVSNTWYDGPSITLAAGTWMISATGHYRRSATTASGVIVRVWDGSQVVANGGASHPSLNGAELEIPAIAPVVLASGKTLTLQMLTTAGSAFSFMKAQTQSSPQGTIATRITAIKLA